MVAALQEVFDEIETPIGGVMPDQIMAVWDRVEPLLRRVVRPHTGYDMDHVLTALQLAKMQLWVIGDFQAVAVTEVQLRPLHNVLWCQFLAGDDMEQWLGDWEKVQAEFGRANNCAAIEFSGRKGWKKLQSKYRHYKPVLTTYRREL